MSDGSRIVSARSSRNFWLWSHLPCWRESRREDAAFVHRHLAAQRIRAARTAAGESGHALGTATRKPVSRAERYGRLDNILRNVIPGSASVLIWANWIACAEPVTIDLTRWTPPDIATVGDDPFGKLVKYGHALFTDTAK